MLGITDLATYIVGTIFIILLPGPNSLYVLSVAAKRGVRAGYQGAAAVVVGDSILMIAAAAGVGSLLSAYPGVFTVIKYAGGAYLVWIGVQLIRAAFNRWRHGEAMLAAAAESAPEDTSHPFKRALFISVINPKAILFFVSFFIQFVDPAYPHPVLTFAVLGGILQVISIIYLSTLILVGSRVAAAFRRRHRTSAAMTGGVGILFIGFGAKLATATIE
ncbi:MAG: leucine efflux protein LeuE [Betaproteobacteria bacterium]|nr:leucine efflux protein LeuE [Betaproteobacteria bacterium]